MSLFLQPGFHFPVYLTDSNYVCLFFVASSLIEHAFRYKTFNYFGVRALQDMQASKRTRPLVLGAFHALPWRGGVLSRRWWWPESQPPEACLTVRW